MSLKLITIDTNNSRSEMKVIYIIISVKFITLCNFVIK